MTAALLSVAPAVEAAGHHNVALPKPKYGTAVPYKAVKRVRKDPALAAATKAAALAKQPVKWPTSTDVKVTAPDVGAAGKEAPQAKTTTTTDPSASGLTVTVASHAAATAAGVNGALLKVTRPATATSSAKVSLDYSGFANAYGGDFGARLALVQLPACVLTTPQKAECRTKTPVATDNNVKAQTLSASIPASLSSAAVSTMVLAADSTAKSGAGSYQATSLAPSASWSGGGGSGDFSWSYPLSAPTPAAGPSPSLAINYDSQSVDGLGPSTNNQPSWIGEGFDLGTSYIERSYDSCEDDNVVPVKYDECWANDNATLMLNGSASPLILDTKSQQWHPKDDDGERVVRSTGAVNGDNDGEYWTVTTTDGTQYVFGKERLPGWSTGDPVTNSTLTVPVFGDDAGEPCHASTFAASVCTQAWRWNLDYVVDTHHNAMSYWYTKESNSYGENGTTTAKGTAYDRASYLDHINYGQTDSTFFGNAPDQVKFTTAERCLVVDKTEPCTSLTSTTKADWPDVPFDQVCAADTVCTNNPAPTFFSRKRLTGITTKVWDASPAKPGYRDVDSWALDQSFVDPGDGTSASLWLKSITRTGEDGGTKAMPPVTFEGTPLPNRVDTTHDDIAALVKWRVKMITTETGSEITANYDDSADTNQTGQCVAGTKMPSAPDSDTMLCYPVIWTTPQGKVQTDWFRKYLVKQVVQSDPTGHAPNQETDYTYANPAWHYDTDNVTSPEADKTWSQWRGFGLVTTTTGNDQSVRTKTVDTYFQGMDGDKRSDGTTRSATVVDSNGTKVTDSDELSGQTREARVFNGSAELSSTIIDEWSKDTGSDGTRTSYYVRPGVSHARTDRASGTPRTATVSTSYDPATGNVTQVDDAGDDAVSGDEQCTRTTYADNTTAWIRDTPDRVETVDVACDATTKRPDDVVTDNRSLYDNAAFGVPPTTGEVTSTQRVSSYNGTTPVYQTVSTSTFDSQGRGLTVSDAEGNTTYTIYTPTTGGPLTSVVTKDAKLYGTTTTFDPARNLKTSTADPNGKRTDFAYDPLGRLTSVWLPTRSKSGGQNPNTTYDYGVSPTAASYVRTGTIRNDGTSYTYAYTFYDAMLRPRQIQAPGPNGGRVITETKYDSRGLDVEDDGDYVDASDPSSTLANITSTEPSQTLTTYDGASRPTLADFYANGTYKWSTTTIYGGDRTTVIPPKGGVATTNLSDTAGNTIETRQYDDGTDSGPYTSIKYGYDAKNRLTTVTDAGNNVWKYGYDLMGRKTSTTDPDAGPSTSTYTDLDQLQSTTDSRGKTISYTYDELGRKTGEYDAPADQQSADNQLAKWTYDSVQLGQPTSSIRYVGGSGTSGVAYMSQVGTYDAMYRPVHTRVVIPSVPGEEALAGSYVSDSDYFLDGTLNDTTEPAAGGMPQETLKYGYNSLTMPATLQGAYSYVRDTQYTELGQIAQITMATAKQVQETNSYDIGTDRLNRQLVTDDTGSGVVQDSHYAYDDSGNPTMADTRTDSVDDTQCFQYDGHDRLTAAFTTADTWQTTGACTTAPTDATLGSGPAPYWQSYTYDVLGNRKIFVQHATSAGGADTTTSYGYGAPADSLNGTQPHTQTSSSTTTPTSTTTNSYGYDAAGNTTSRDLNGTTQNLHWDDEGHLASDQLADGTTASYLYDADGNRLLTRDATGTTLFLGDTEIHLDKDTTNTSATRYYSWLGQTIAVRTTSGSFQWVLTDAHNTATTQIDATTQAATYRRTDPFGNDRGTAMGPWAGDQGFVGGTQDATTDLTHLGARDYDPTTGRFISLDPVLELTDPQQINGYGYAADNPVTGADPDGLMPYIGVQDGPGPKPKPAKPGTTPGDGYRHGTGTGAPLVRGDGRFGDVDTKQQWTQEWTPGSNDADNLTSDFFADSSNNMENTDSYWNPIRSENGHIVNVCFGRTACARAYKHLIEHPHDVAGAKEIAANYCITNFKECEADADIQAGVEASINSLIQIMGMMDLPEGGEPAGTGCSFTPTTPVLMADGKTKPIAKVKPGDKVQAANPDNGKHQGPRAVTATWLNHDSDLIDLTIETTPGQDSVLHTTSNHPLWDDTTHQWVPAGKLTLGDSLETATNQRVRLAGRQVRPGVADMYNLTVDQSHTYYVLVGSHSVLVHNVGGKCGTGGFIRKLFARSKTDAEIADEDLLASRVPVRLGDLVGVKTPDYGDKEKVSEMEGMDDERLIDAINNPDRMGGSVVIKDGEVQQGNHRMHEALERVRKGEIDPDTMVMVVR
ncbi:polymorphic toxin-type HINT domain-containing protein [Streptomyces sp. NBC_00669]|uniref:polymorphic toxin-type HINT domain-containing protein n=1 Tax=Streptomyces sp. NBC_00669 TaxID=2976011 RepID=UPI002E338B3F|nr:polymorphic toxin-type HINT domain-containing protein [Streptomyces sp. NBC_00669]